MPPYSAEPIWIPAFAGKGKRRAREKGRGGGERKGKGGRKASECAESVRAFAAARIFAVALYNPRRSRSRADSKLSPPNPKKTR